MITAYSRAAVAPAGPEFSRPAYAPAPMIAGPQVGLAVKLLAFYLVMRFSMVHDFITESFGFNSRYHYITVPILVVASLVGTRFARVVGSSLGLWFTAFTLWMGACIPTAYWRGGSFGLFKGYLQNEFMIFLVMGCLAAGLAAQKRAMYAMAAVMPLFTFVIAFNSGRTQYAGRSEITFGTYSNPNSIAAHLLFLAPFVVFFLLERKRFGAGSLAALGAIGAGTVYFFRSGSRGGFLALIVVLAVVFARLSVSRKMVALLLLVVMVPASLVLIPRNTLIRYSTIFSDPAEIESGDWELVSTAAGSTLQRKLLFRQSVAISFHNPIFGVGPGNFSGYNAEQVAAAGRRPDWLVTHNGYTQVSSEMGLVGFVFYLGVLITTGIYLRRIRKTVRDIPELRSASRIASCLTISLIAYIVFSTFDYIAYNQYLPLLAGFTVGLDEAVKVELLGLRAAEQAA